MSDDHLIGKPWGPDDDFCLNCGHSRRALQAEIDEYGWFVQECWVEDFTDEGYPTASRETHRFKTPLSRKKWLEKKRNENEKAVSL